MPRRRRQTGTAVGEAGDILGEIAALIQHNRQQKLEEGALAHSQAMEEERLGLAKDELRFRRTEAARQREAAEQAGYETTLPRWKAKAYQHELGAELAGQAGRYAERAGPLAGKVMSKAFEEAGSIDQVNALMAEMGTRINEMDKLAAREEWLKNQPRNVQDYFTWRGFGGDISTGQMLYMLQELMVRETLKGEVKAKTQPPKMSDREKDLMRKIPAIRLKLAEMPDFIEEYTDWDGDPKTLQYYRDLYIASLFEMTPEEQKKYLGGEAAEALLTIPDKQNIFQKFIGLFSGEEEEQFDINSVLKSSEEE